MAECQIPGLLGSLRHNAGHRRYGTDWSSE